MNDDFLNLDFRTDEFKSLDEDFSTLDLNQEIEIPDELNLEDLKSLDNIGDQINIEGLNIEINFDDNLQNGLTQIMDKNNSSINYYGKSIKREDKLADLEFLQDKKKSLAQLVYEAIETEVEFEIDDEIISYNLEKQFEDLTIDLVKEFEAAHSPKHKENFNKIQENEQYKDLFDLFKKYPEVEYQYNLLLEDLRLKLENYYRRVEAELYKDNGTNILFKVSKEILNKSSLKPLEYYTFDNNTLDWSFYCSECGREHTIDNKIGPILFQNSGSLALKIGVPYCKDSRTLYITPESLTERIDNFIQREETISKNKAVNREFYPLPVSLYYKYLQDNNQDELYFKLKNMETKEESTLYGKSEKEIISSLINSIKNNKSSAITYTYNNNPEILLRNKIISFINNDNKLNVFSLTNKIMAIVCSAPEIDILRFYYQSLLKCEREIKYQEKGLEVCEQVLSEKVTYTWQELSSYFFKYDNTKKFMSIEEMQSFVKTLKNNLKLKLKKSKLEFDNLKQIKDKVKEYILTNTFEIYTNLGFEKQLSDLNSVNNYNKPSLMYLFDNKNELNNFLVRAISFYLVGNKLSYLSKKINSYISKDSKLQNLIDRNINRALPKLNLLGYSTSTINSKCLTNLNDSSSFNKYISRQHNSFKDAKQYKMYLDTLEETKYNRFLFNAMKDYKYTNEEPTLKAGIELFKFIGFNEKEFDKVPEYKDKALMFTTLPDLGRKSKAEDYFKSLEFGATYNNNMTCSGDEILELLDLCSEIKTANNIESMKLKNETIFIATLCKAINEIFTNKLDLVEMPKQLYRGKPLEELLSITDLEIHLYKGYRDLKLAVDLIPPVTERIPEVDSLKVFNNNGEDEDCVKYDYSDPVNPLTSEYLDLACFNNKDLNQQEDCKNIILYRLKDYGIELNDDIKLAIQHYTSTVDENKINCKSEDAKNCIYLNMSSYVDTESNLLEMSEKELKYLLSISLEKETSREISKFLNEHGVI